MNTLKIYNKSKYFRYSISAKLVVAVLLTVTCIWIINATYNYSYFFNLLKEQAVRDESQKLQYVVTQVNNMQDEVIRLARQMSIESEIQAIAQYEEKDIFDKLVIKGNIKKKLMSYINVRDYLYSVSVITPYTEILSSNQQEIVFDPAEEAWYGELKEKHPKGGFSRLHGYRLEQEKIPQQVISYLITYRNMNVPQDIIGDIIINVGHKELESLVKLEDTLLSGYALYDKWGDALVEKGTITATIEECLSTKQQELLLENGNILLVNTDLKDGWLFVSEISKALLVDKLKYLQYFFVGVGIIGLVLVYIILYYFIKKLMNPVEQLHQAAIEVGKGNFSFQVNIHTCDEWEVLGHAFNNMVNNIENLMKESVEKERILKEMELNRLMLQINPHFIYNTLNNIVYMAQKVEATEIIAFTNAFTSLLQDTIKLNKDSIMTTLDQEIKNIKNYLILQQYRYPDRFEITYSYDEKLLKCEIPNILLQPLVENAIFHGLAAKLEKGSLVITITQVEEQLRLSVADSGIGMSKERIQDLLQNDQEIKGEMRSIGVANVRQRIQQIYGAKGNLTIDSVEGVGTQVVIHIPYYVARENN
ncbi:hypothetical protein CS063_03420 [Sporanaerobium hydrogeniformans]|uniref:Uncharacterized protein n=1 Tax=Sporanaerobium hydrogeniformans TaxID=3072179 RepID=A0AC61DEM0_9FIRM|nr:histidine kinase [Sporanaerobium hydrogeniformans]PHV71626.1 hypothetical protein CS063_03420 [Sporanaerobium hydrogeniformans]